MESNRGSSRRLTKVIRFRILKPADGLSWAELGEMLRQARYRTFRLANLAVSEAYLAFHLHRTGRSETLTKATIGQLSRQLRDQLAADDKVKPEDLDRFSKIGALPDTVTSALSQYKIGALTAPSKWRDVVRGKSALPTFRLDMSVPIRCDKPGHRRLERTESGDVVLDLMICRQPYPRVMLQTGAIGGGAEAILKRLLDNPTQLMEGYRQRCFEVKHDERSRQWHLFITYDFPAPAAATFSPQVVVGVDLGVSCPLYVALSNGHARLGRREFASLGARIRSLQRQTIARRRAIQRGGRVRLSTETARTGHGRKRKLMAIDVLDGRINRAYTTLNHQLSAAVVDFARQHGAGVIQIEDLAGLQEALRGTYIGANWRYHQLQTFLAYKADEAGIKLHKVNPRYTSRRCSKCGHIHAAFDRTMRDSGRTDGMVRRFECPAPGCGFVADPDYNAARNLATLDIADLIKRQCKMQGLNPGDLCQSDEEAVASTEANPTG